MERQEWADARVQLLAEVDEAARVVAPLWPLSTFIAVNPLWDLRHLPFDEAVAHAGQVLGIGGYPSPSLLEEAYRTGRVTDEDLRAGLGEVLGVHGSPVRCTTSSAGLMQRRVRSAAELHDEIEGSLISAAVDREVAKWCAAYLSGVLPDPGGTGFYASWRAIVASDPAVRAMTGRSGQRRVASLGADAEDAMLRCLDMLGIGKEDRVPELARQLARMPGWAGHAKWRSRWAAPDHPGPALRLVEYLAVRLCYEAVLLESASNGTCKIRRRSGLRPPRPRSAADHHVPDGEGTWQGGSTGPWRTVPGPDGDVGTQLGALDAVDAERVWLTAYEHHYRNWLLAALDRSVVTRVAGPDAQAVFCIDVRSEGLRRHLEAEGPFETFGFAGFFGLPIRYRPWGAAQTVDLCPVLIRPSTGIAETVAAGSLQAADRQLAGWQGINAAQKAFAVAKEGSVSPFVLAEASGFAAGPIALAKTVLPRWYQAARRRLRSVVAAPVPTIVDADPSTDVMSDEEQALFAETALTTMGMVHGLAPLVLLCGHGSTMENNPYASSLDCGACGGNRGGASARSAVAILNRRVVRRLLAERGIVIPDETVFIAGEHDTATDQVQLFDVDRVPSSHRSRVTALRAALDRAGERLAVERARSLPGADSFGHLARPAQRSADWAQVRPEWGLARNAAFIVAPRAVTAGVDLERRCFLHSYDATVDPEGVALETILTAPMVVAHWINAQYYFSTVDAPVLSAGDKTAHNIVAGVGVMLGAGGDLCVGLPLQSLFDGERAYHEPMRLLTVIQAPHALIDAVIARNPLLRDLFDGEWVHVAARAEEGGTWKIRQPGGSWSEWTLSGTAVARR